MNRTFLAVFLMLPLMGQSEAKRKGALTTAQSNPMYQENKAQGVNPLFQDTQRKVQGILGGLKPSTTAKLQAAADELSRTHDLNGPEATVWQAAEAATRKAFGASMPADAEGTTAVVICCWAAKRGYDYYKASASLNRAANVLKTRHDTVKNSINNVR